MNFGKLRPTPVYFFYCECTAVSQTVYALKSIRLHMHCSQPDCVCTAVSESVYALQSVRLYALQSVSLCMHCSQSDCMHCSQMECVCTAVSQTVCTAVKWSVYTLKSAGLHIHYSQSHCDLPTNIQSDIISGQTCTLTRPPQHSTTIRNPVCHQCHQCHQHLAYVQK